MNLIVLGGNSPVNQKWVDAVVGELKQYFDKTDSILYDHWESSEQIVNIENEANKLSKLIMPNKKTVVLAKSVGIIIALHAMQRNNVDLRRCIFLGLPLLWCHEQRINLNKYLKDYSVDTIFIQQENDKYGSYDDVKNMLKIMNVSNYKIKKINGEDHSYSDIKIIKKLILTE